MGCASAAKSWRCRKRFGAKRRDHGIPSATARLFPKLFSLAHIDLRSHNISKKSGTKCPKTPANSGFLALSDLHAHVDLCLGAVMQRNAALTAGARKPMSEKERHRRARQRRWATRTEAMAYAKVGSTTMNQWLHEHRIYAKKHGPKVIIDLNSIDDHIESLPDVKASEDVAAA
jgi:hypothetical protein